MKKNKLKIEKGLVLKGVVIHEDVEGNRWNNSDCPGHRLFTRLLKEYGFKEGEDFGIFGIIGYSIGYRPQSEGKVRTRWCVYSNDDNTVHSRKPNGQSIDMMEVVPGDIVHFHFL